MRSLISHTQHLTISLYQISNAVSGRSFLADILPQNCYRSFFHEAMEFFVCAIATLVSMSLKLSAGRSKPSIPPLGYFDSKPSILPAGNEYRQRCVGALAVQVSFFWKQRKFIRKQLPFQAEYSYRGTIVEIANLFLCCQRIING
jgi:hypothetical protein